jgi:hypothetical protein
MPTGRLNQRAVASGMHAKAPAFSLSAAATRAEGSGAGTSQSAASGGASSPEVSQLHAQPSCHPQLGQLQMPHVAMRVDRQPLTHSQALDLERAAGRRGRLQQQAGQDTGVTQRLPLQG